MNKFNLSVNLIFTTIFVFMFFMFFNGLKLQYPPYYTVLPFFFFGVFGFCLNIIKIDKKHLIILLLIGINFFVYILSALFNQIFIFDYIKQIPLLFLFNFFAAYFLVKLSYNIFPDKNYFFKLIILSVLFQNIISFLSYINPSVYSFIFSIVDVGLENNQIDSFNSARIVGVGASFFGAGVQNSFFLVLLTILYQKKIIKSNFFYLLCFSIIAIFGLMLSRTTFIGILLSLIIIIIGFKKAGNFKIFIFFFFSSFLAIFMIPIFSGLDDRVVDIFKFGFEFIYNFEDSQAKDSVSEIPQMLSQLPSKFSTWLVGDAQYMNEYGGYYNNIDVGYSRIIYATGVLGLLSYISVHFYLIMINQLFYGYRKYIFILFFALNVKGVANLFPFLILLYFYKSDTSNKI